MTQFTDLVQRPYQYSGGEYGKADVNKPHTVKVCLSVADSYDIGMSNLGLRILYYLTNSLDGIVAERCFAPWADYVEYLKKHNLPLVSLESKTPLMQFDFLAFSMQFELCYSNFFYMLELSGIPFCTADRQGDLPFVAAGGPCAVNLEPLYKFLDFVFVGDGETVWTDILTDWKNLKGNVTKAEFLKIINDKYDCVYVPGLSDIEYAGDSVKQINCKTVKRNIVQDLAKLRAPNRQLVPNIEVVHDRAVLEIFRGCPNGCRFCQAGFVYRPVRELSAEDAFKHACQLVEYTGYDELSLNSLSTSDYSQLTQLLDLLVPYAKQNSVKLNMPSMRLDSYKSEYTAANRKSSLTFAPEAGSQRLRDVINKNITEDDIFSAIKDAFGSGYNSVKLYFMIGLPTETMEDVKAIADIAFRIKSMYKQHKTSSKALRISVSASTFVPKPFTPFQWEQFDTRENINAKQKFLHDTFKARGISFSYTDYDTSTLEAMLARGGRSLADSLLCAYKKGARFDAWSEHFNWQYYKEAFDECGVNIDTVVGKKDFLQPLAWDFVDIGIDKKFLQRECELAYQSATTPPCTVKCENCGLKCKGAKQ